MKIIRLQRKIEDRKEEREGERLGGTRQERKGSGNYLLGRY